MARRSARLSSRKSSTPQPIKRVSLSHDGQAPRTVPAKLTSLMEDDEMPGAYPDSPIPEAKNTAWKQLGNMPTTPTHAPELKAATAEMHPQIYHQSTAKSHEDARWLGFSDKDPNLNAENPSSISTNILGTPSRRSNATEQTKSPYTFAFKREQSLELSPAAKSLMQEKRAEIARIKNQMKSQEDGAGIANMHGRKIATPRAQKSRFSDAHNAAFDKMDSIAGHASAYRKDPSHVGTPAKFNTNGQTPSKAFTFGSTTSSAKKLSSITSKQSISVHKTDASAVPAQHAKRLQAEMNDESPSPRKRVKRSDTSTPQKLETSATVEPETVLNHLTTPTKSTLARAASTKAVKPSAIPAPARTPSKLADPNTTSKPVAASLSQSPLKAAIFGSPVVQKTAQSTDAYLARSPLRAVTAQETTSSPTKTFASKLLACSPSKLENKSQDASSLFGTRLLTQTPAKAKIMDGAEKPFASHSKVGNVDLNDRFRLLRKSPVKSILRTPQRLYSNDPAKVAAGTHLATPTKLTGAIGRVVPATAPVRKHVEFSSSTKAREAVKTAPAPTEEIAYPTIDKVDYPVLDISISEPASPSKRRQSSIPRDFTFRAGADIVFAPTQVVAQSFSPRSVNSPSTIRRVYPEESELRVPTTNSKKRKIEFEDAASVAKLEASPTVVLGSKKRKFDFENDVVEKSASAIAIMDKENIATESEDEKRPAKRFKTNPAVETAKPVAVKKESILNKKRPTLGVKPKHEMRKSPEKQNKKSGPTISRARLNALAMPKKRS